MDTSFDLFNAVLDSNYNVVNGLINKGTDVNCTFKSGEMALHLSIEKGQTDIALLLINSGCDINTKNGHDKTPLFLAAEFNNVGVVKALLNKPNLNVNLFCYGETPLHVACTEGHVDIVREFVGSYRTMFWLDIRFQGNLPIHLAIYNGSSDVVELLLDKITSVNTPDKDGMTPLWLALKRKKSDVIKLLLNNYRVNINIRFDGFTPLMFGIKEHMEDAVRLLVDKGVNIKAKDSDKRTVLHHCALESMSCLIQLFIDKGVDLSAVDSKGYTAFHYAVTRWNVDVIIIFIKNNIDIDGRLVSESGFTPLQLAFKRGNLDVAKLLIQNGADINAIDPYAHFAMRRGGNLLHWACRNDARSDIEFLIENGANINAEENDGRTPLCLLVKHHGRLDSIKYLIDNGAELNTDRGGAPLYWAFYCNYYDIADFLIKNGSDVNGCKGNFDSWDLRRTPLHLANNLSTVKLLIDCGANVNAIDTEGNTPLHKASVLPIANYLVDNGANIHSCNFLGDTPLHTAKNVHLAEFFIEKGANVNALNHKGASPLHTAKNPLIAQILMDHGADINAITKDGRTVLHTVADADLDFLESADLIDFYIQQGIDPNKLDNQGNSAVKFSSLRWNHNVTWRLLNNGASIRLFNIENSNLYQIRQLNDLFEALKTVKPITKSMSMIRMQYPLNYKEEDTKSTILHVAVKYGRKDFVKHLLSTNRDTCHNSYLTLTNRINLNAEDIDGNTPLHIAAIENNISSVKLLLSAGAIYNCKNLSGKIPLDLTDNTEIKEVLRLAETAFDAVKHNDTDKLAECIKIESCIINCLNETGSSLLHIACTNLNSDTITLLLQNSADVTLVNDKKATPLHLIVPFDNKDMLFILLRHFVKHHYLFNNSRNKSTFKPSAKTSIFFNYINLKTIDGKTALHMASELGSLDNVKFLLRCGAMFNCSDNNGNMPIHYSTVKDITAVLTTVQELFNDAKNGNEEIIAKLKDPEINDVISFLTTNKYGDTLDRYMNLNGYRDLADEIKPLLEIPFEVFNESGSSSKPPDCDEASDLDDYGFDLFD